MPDTETSILLYSETKNKDGLCFKFFIETKNEDFGVTFVNPLENDLKPSFQIPIWEYGSKTENIRVPSFLC